MADTKRKDRSLILGVMALSAAGVLVKVAGLLFRVPLTKMIGSSGMGYFNSAYTIWSFFYLISTAGLPVALSILVSKARATNDIQKCRKLLTVALRIFSALGFALSLIMLLFAGTLSKLISNPGAKYSIAAIAPSVLLTCVISAYRGYFQGFQNMVPTALSQLAEALGKLGFGLLFAHAALVSGADAGKAAAAAISGVTLSSALALLLLIICKALFKEDKGGEKCVCVSSKRLAGRLIKISLPISASFAVTSLSGLLDLAIVMRRLQSVGYTAGLSNAIYGGYTAMSVPLFNLPSVLITPIACSAVPFIAKAAASGDLDGVKKSADGCFKYAMIISAPAGIGLSVFSERILSLMFGKTAAAGEAGMLALLSLSLPFAAITNVTAAIMQACGRTKLPIISMSAGSAAKLISAWLLIGRYGMSGTPLSTLICYLTITALNLLLLRSVLKIKTDLFKTGLPALILAGLSVAAALILLNMMTGIPESAGTLAAVAFAAVIYLVLLLGTRVISPAELEGFPVIGKIIKERQKDVKRRKSGGACRKEKI